MSEWICGGVWIYALASYNVIVDDGDLVYVLNGERGYVLVGGGCRNGAVNSGKSAVTSPQV
jgi:hypothetical protein